MASVILSVRGIQTKFQYAICRAIAARRLASLRRPAPIPHQRPRSCLAYLEPLGACCESRDSIADGEPRTGEEGVRLLVQATPGPNVYPKSLGAVDVLRVSRKAQNGRLGLVLATSLVWRAAKRTVPSVT